MTHRRWVTKRTGMAVVWLLVGGAATFLPAGCKRSGDNDGAKSDEQRVVSYTSGDGDVCYRMEGIWDGGYQIVDHNCHNAANENLDAGNAGIISCQGHNSGPSGHTINYDFINGQTCVGHYNSEACCWPGGSPIDTSSAAAQSCIALYCESADAAVALDAGVPWPTEYTDCSGRFPGSSSDCSACCDANADKVLELWPKETEDAEEYRQRCKESCSGGSDAAPPPPPDQCVAEGWASDGSLLSKKFACKRCCGDDYAPHSRELAECRGRCDAMSPPPCPPGMACSGGEDP